MNSKISIIVPVYNVEKYLSKCLDTLIRQNYQHLEIILVNDGSTDKSSEICAKYAAEDSRIKLIDRENGGLSAARNSGLEVASGDYISFVDSDDILSLSFCECLLRAATIANADIVECGFTRFFDEQQVEQKTSVCSGISETFSAEESLNILMQEKLNQVVWNKIYRREVMTDLQFPVGKLNEDEFFTYRAFGNAKKIVKIPEVLYYYRQHAESIMGRKYTLQRLHGLNALEERITYMQNNFPNLANQAIRIFCMASIWHYQQLTINFEIDFEKKYRKKILERMRRFNKTAIIAPWGIAGVFWFRIFLLAPDFCAKFRNYFSGRFLKIRNLLVLKSYFYSQ